MIFYGNRKIIESSQAICTSQVKYLNTTSKMINLYMSNINNIRNGDKRLMLTEYINSKLSINWREESIHKVNKPPSYIKSNCYWKQDDTANKPRVRNCCIEQNKHVSTKTAYSYKLQIIWPHTQNSYKGTMPVFQVELYAFLYIIETISYGYSIYVFCSHDSSLYV